MSNLIIRNAPRRSYGGFSAYGKTREQQYEEDGKVQCKKHISKWFDPKRHTGCYLCFLERVQK